MFAKVLREPHIYKKMEEEAMSTQLTCYEDLRQLKYIESVSKGEFVRQFE